MKRIGILLFALLLGYALFYDMTVGTLPLLKGQTEEAAAQPTEAKQTAATEEQAAGAYQQIEVKSGDTVLSIVEAINKNNKLPSVTTITSDFKKLNVGESPSKLRIGKSYKFPLYK